MFQEARGLAVQFFGWIWKDTTYCTSQIVNVFVLRVGLFVNHVLVQGNLNGHVL